MKTYNLEIQSINISIERVKTNKTLLPRIE